MFVQIAKTLYQVAKYYRSCSVAGRRLINAVSWLVTFATVASISMYVAIYSNTDASHVNHHDCRITNSSETVVEDFATLVPQMCHLALDDDFDFCRTANDTYLTPVDSYCYSGSCEFTLDEEASGSLEQHFHTNVSGFQLSQVQALRQAILQVTIAAEVNFTLETTCLTGEDTEDFMCPEYLKFKSRIKEESFICYEYRGFHYFDQPIEGSITAIWITVISSAFFLIALGFTIARARTVIRQRRTRYSEDMELPEV